MKWTVESLPNWKEFYWGEDASLEAVTAKISEHTAKFVIDEITRNGYLRLDANTVVLIAFDGELIIESPLTVDSTWADIYDKEGLTELATAFRRLADEVEALAKTD